VFHSGFVFAVHETYLFNQRAWMHLYFFAYYDPRDLSRGYSN